MISDARLVVGGERLQRGAELPHRFEVERVLDVGPVDRQRGDRLGDVQLQILVHVFVRVIRVIRGPLFRVIRVSRGPRPRIRG